MAVPILQIMAWKTVGMALSSSAGQIIIIEHVQKWAAIRNIIGCITCIGLNFLLIPKYGIIGSAWTTIITVLMAGSLGNIFIPPYYGILKLQINALFKGWKSILNLTKSLKQ